MTKQSNSYIHAALLARRAELADRESRVERDLGRRNESLSTDSAEQAIQLQNDEVLNAIGAGARQEIAAIDAALQRIQEDRYGICKRCGKPIGEARMRAAPYATECAVCAVN